MKVLVAIDDKPNAQAIIDALIKMHWYEGTELHVITVRENPDPVALTEIEDLAVALHDALPHSTVSFLPTDGEPSHAILSVARQMDADLIVIGSNCKNTLERLLIGSVGQKVLSHAGCPVIVAKTPCCLAREASPGFKNILIPVDNSVFSDVAVAWLANFGWAPDCKFILCAAIEEDTDRQEVVQSLQNRAMALSKLVGTKNVFAEVMVGEPKDVVLKLANKYYADLITIGSHGRTGLRKLILGNVAQAISHEAPCAVAVVRGIAPDDEKWYDTGAYHKVEPIPAPHLVARRRDDREVMSHVMPSGM